ncbi:MAG: aldehyde ferredoxin oxidoreductase family protein [Chloroflexota bacterium]
MVTSAGRFLRINLSTGKTSREAVDEQARLDFVGGRGYGIRQLYRELAPGAEPLSADNKLIIVAGVLAGTSAQAVSRWMVYTRSPLTGAVARSVCGADFGAWLKFAGYDFLLLEGKAERPVYLHITPENCEIKDAGELWGKDTKVTQDILLKRHGKDTRFACIGPAGEKLVRYASVVSGRRTAGRCGTGAVFGAKNLKAIAITTQRNLDHLHDPERVRELAKAQIDSMMQSKGFLRHKDMGTTGTQVVTNEAGIFPVKNFRYGRLTGWEKLQGEDYRKLRTGEFGCYSCAARCGKAHHVKGGPYDGAYSEGPEYETIWAFTAPTDCHSIEATIAADELCDDFGMDTISTGSSIGFAFELYEKGILTKKDVDGLELTYGNDRAMVELVKKIGNREGIGDLLAEGTRRAAATIGKGAEHYAIHVKGLELPAYEPRGAKSQGYSYATSAIGANHTYGYARQEIFGVPIPRPVDRFAEEENAEIVVYNQDRIATSETGTVCAFAAGWPWYDEIFHTLLAAATGVAAFDDIEYMRQVGKRIVTLERAFNVREGFGRKDDSLPARLREEPLMTRGAPGEGQTVSHQDEFLDRYYQLRGWTEDGVPTPETLRELNLAFVVPDMP